MRQTHVPLVHKTKPAVSLARRVAEDSLGLVYAMDFFKLRPARANKPVPSMRSRIWVKLPASYVFPGGLLQNRMPRNSICRGHCAVAANDDFYAHRPLNLCASCNVRIANRFHVSGHGLTSGRVINRKRT